MIVECPTCKSRYDVSGRPPGTQARCRCGCVFTLPEPSREASKLSCPSCGGNVKTGASECEFCDAALLVKACPRCFAKIFHGAKHCNECGAQVEVPAIANPDGSARRLGCPACDTHNPLLARLVGETLLDECTHCHGIWLDSQAVDRLIRERKQVCTDAVLGMGQHKRAQIQQAPATRTRTYLKCPECETIMNRTNFAKRSGILVDTCKGHGTWFDRGELPRVVEFVAQGGIEASQERELRRLQEESRREKAKIRAMKSPGGIDMRSQGGLSGDPRLNKHSVVGEIVNLLKDIF